MKETLTDLKDIGFSLTKPCGDCPFRVDAPFHEGVLKDVVTIFNAIDDGKFSFSCHKTDPRADGNGKHIDGKAHHCAGALVLQRNMGVLHRNKALLAAAFHGWFRPWRIKKSKEVFSGPYEMLKHYIKGYRIAHPEKAEFFSELDLR